MIAFLISVRTEEYALIQDEIVSSVTALVLDTKAMSVLMVSHAYILYAYVSLSQIKTLGNF